MPRQQLIEARNLLIGDPNEAARDYTRAFMTALTAGLDRHQQARIFGETSIEFYRLAV